MVLPNKKLRGNSQNWLNYQSTLSITTCSECKSRHGKIVSSDDKMAQSTLLLHLFCQCLLLPMRTLIAGTATNLSLNGADYYLMFYGTLPKYYITKKEAKDAGWDQSKGNLSDVLPQKMIGGDIFYNSKSKLPEKTGRIWYEADINYVSGFRNSSRILYSNDGLIFVTYDHYQTFYEITK